MLTSSELILPPVVCREGITEVMELVEITSVVSPLLLSESVENGSSEVVICIPVVVVSKL